MAITIRLAEERDRDQVLSLLNSSFSDIQRSSQERGIEYWDWKFLENPFGKAILTIAETEGKIIAVNNLWPWEFNVRGTILKALQPCDSVVHPDFRGKGLFKQMRFHGLGLAKENGYSMLFNFPNKNSLPAYLSLGWHSLGKIEWRVKILKPLKLIGSITSKGKTEHVIIGKEYAIDTDLIDRIAGDNLSFDGYLKTNRIPGFHEWRYKEHPYRYYGMIVYEKGSRSTAAIFTINRNGANREMVIVDFVGNEGFTNEVLDLACKEGRSMDASFLAVMENERYRTSELWKSGYVKARLKNMVVLPIT